MKGFHKGGQGGGNRFPAAFSWVKSGSVGIVEKAPLTRGVRAMPSTRGFSTAPCRGGSRRLNEKLRRMSARHYPAFGRA